MFLYFVSLILVAGAALIQTTSVAELWSVKPNLVFVVLAVISGIEKNWGRRAMMILISAVILKFSPVIGWIDMIFIFTAFLVVALMDYLPWRRAINSILAVAAGTVIMGISSFNPEALATELAINALITIIIFIIFELIYAQKKEKSRNRFR